MMPQIMRKIAIDCRFTGSNSGLGQYTRELVTHLLMRKEAVEHQNTATEKSNFSSIRGNMRNPAPNANSPINEKSMHFGARVKYTIIARSASEPWLKNLQGDPEIIIADIPHYSLAEQTRIPKLLKKSKVDLLFSPHFNVPFRLNIPFVVTIHDLILHRFPNQASPFKQFVYRRIINSAVKRARHIITISDFVKRELIDVYGDPIRSKITRIYEGVDSRFTPAAQEEIEKVLKKFSLLKPFFLYIGNAKQHKNVQVLIDAFAALNQPDRELVLVTGGKEAGNLRPVEGVRIISDVEDADLPPLYSSALAFVTASLYEGFCLPVAEAESCGCKVIASSRGAIPEVAGDNAALVDADTESIRSAMEEVEFMGTPKPKNFSWEQAAKETATILLS